MVRVSKAVIPAAGLGTRFLPATKAQPKEMLPIVDTPIIQYVVEEAVNAGIKDILIVTGRGKRAIENHFDYAFELEYFLEQDQKDTLLEAVREVSDLADIHLIRQKRPLGLGHAVYRARRHVGNEPFAVLLGDEIFDASVPCIKQLIDCYEEHGTTVVGTKEVPREETSRYGIVTGEELSSSLMKVTDLIEKPDPAEAPSTRAVVGRYVIDPEIFEILEHTRPGVNEEIQLTDALKELNRRRGVYAYNVAGKRYDVGDKFGFLQATVEFALKREDLGPQFKEYLLELLGSKTNSPQGGKREPETT